MGTDFGMTRAGAPTVGNKCHYTTHSTDTYTNCCCTAPLAMYCLHSKVPYIISIWVQSVYLQWGERVLGESTLPILQVFLNYKACTSL